MPWWAATYCLLILGSVPGRLCGRPRRGDWVVSGAVELTRRPNYIGIRLYLLVCHYSRASSWLWACRASGAFPHSLPLVVLPRPPAPPVSDHSLPPEPPETSAFPSRELGTRRLVGIRTCRQQAVYPKFLPRILIHGYRQRLVARRGARRFSGGNTSRDRTGCTRPPKPIYRLPLDPATTTPFGYTRTTERSMHEGAYYLISLSPQTGGFRCGPFAYLLTG